ncbi:MAG: hypothetical protein COA34_005690 [Methylophaga sp.]|jgi:hypothetical protein|uniref:hypothetical protein n=1 Tax=Methylophaga sp. TaxID=2024840 RepID=UPI000C10DCCD|nr:hypothetical protein [Methylophaga sp.]MBL1457346.1 hypothetical protein [Methylophaga sp.]
MARSNNKRNATTKDALNYKVLAFRDYLAARHLLIDDFLLQGILLSSFSIEKYLKAILAVRGIPAGKKHIDKVNVFKRLFEINSLNFFDYFDERYLWLLSRVYELRYYDHIKGEKSVGFYKWQVLAELDFMVNLIESSISIKNGIKDIKTMYFEHVDTSNTNLVRENYIYNNIEKKDFMERKGPACILLFDDKISNCGGSELITEIRDSSVKYTGQICLIKASLNISNKNTESRGQPI